MMMIRTKSQHIIWFADDDNDQDKILNLHLRFCLSEFIPPTSDTLTEQKSECYQPTDDGRIKFKYFIDNKCYNYSWEVHSYKWSPNGLISELISKLIVEI